MAEPFDLGGAAISLGGIRQDASAGPPPGCPTMGTTYTLIATTGALTGTAGGQENASGGDEAPATTPTTSSDPYGG